MQTLALARKYRPRNFSEMTGQEHVVRALRNAIEHRRLHHAYLFTGTRGIGKTTVSRILAKSLNCTGEGGDGDITASPCGRCAACRDIDADRFVDYVELDAASNRSIDEIRELIERAAYKPAVGRYKVFMIDEAHQLTKDACNALLKTLEEPPEYLKFILATTDPQRMLPTVLSRCLQFNLRPMAPELIAQHLRQVLEAEGLSFEEAGLRGLAQAARGSMRDALSLADQAIAYGGGHVSMQGVQSMLGVGGGDLALDILHHLAAHEARAVLGIFEDMRNQGISAVAVLEELVGALQTLALAQAGVSPDESGLEPTKKWATIASCMEPQELQLLYSILLQGRHELALMPDELSALVMLLLRFLAFAAPQALQAGTQAPPAGALRMPGPARMAVAAAPPDALADRWEITVRELATQGVLSGLVRELAWQSQLVQCGEQVSGNGETWVLRVEHESLRVQALRDRLENALQAATGQQILLQLQAGTPQDSPALRESRARSLRQQQAEEAMRDDPLVGDLLAQFPGAKLVPGSVRPA